MSYEDINTVLRQVIDDNSYFGLGAENWQSSPNVDLSSDSSKARVSFSYAQPIPAEIGSSNSELISGFMQIDLYYPSGQGDYAINAKAQEIKAAFKPQRLILNDTNVRVISSGINTQPATDNGWYNLFIEVDFSTYYCN